MNKNLNKLNESKRDAKQLRSGSRLYNHIPRNLLKNKQWTHNGII